jgi:hypothetical protein
LSIQLEILRTRDLRIFTEESISASEQNIRKPFDKLSRAPCLQQVAGCHKKLYVVIVTIKYELVD